MQSSLRRTDNKVEAEIGKFLDSKFYNHAPFDSFQRIIDKQQQLSGMDVVISSKSINLSNAIVDEKCAAHYVNKDIPTFAFELSFLLDDGTEVQGWLLDKNKKTEYYLLLWPSATVTNNSVAPDFKCDDITKLDYILIKRSRIIEYLLSKGFDEPRIQKGIDYMRSECNSAEQQEHLKDIYRNKFNFYFTISRKLDECPVNVILYRTDLKRIGCLIGSCDSSGTNRYWQCCAR